MTEKVLLAQTYPQLMNQLLAANYNENDLTLVKSAFNLSQAFADGLYRAQGVPLLNHLVRTASILVVEKQPASIVVTGLLHAAFLLHKFDNSTRTYPNQQRQKQIADATTAAIAKLVAAYPELDWFKSSSLQQHIDNATSLDDTTHALVIVQLANELEDHLDRAMDYTAACRRAHRQDAYFELCIELAVKMQLPFIATSLKTVAQQNSQFSPPELLTFNAEQGYELPNKRLWQRAKLKQALLAFKQKLMAK